MKIDPKCVGCIGFKICAHDISVGDDECEKFNKSVEALKIVDNSGYYAAMRANDAEGY
jgi:hypothetical protein